MQAEQAVTTLPVPLHKAGGAPALSAPRQQEDPDSAEPVLGLRPSACGILLWHQDVETSLDQGSSIGTASKTGGLTDLQTCKSRVIG